MDALIEAGATEVNRDRRIEIYQELQALVLQTHQLVFLGYLTPPIFVSDRVQNVDTQGTAAGRVNFRGVWLSQ
jgi:ABC-type transport system substrate-binding protein